MPEFCNKELIICATVSLGSSFCWPYRASPSLAANNIVSLISVSTIMWCPCVELSLVLWEMGVCDDQCALLAKLLAFALLHFVLQGQTCLLLQLSLDFLLLHSSPLSWEGYLFWVLVLEGLVELFSFGIRGWGIDLDYCGIEWFDLEKTKFCHFWDCTEVLHVRFLCWLWGLLHFF